MKQSPRRLSAPQPVRAPARLLVARELSRVIGGASSVEYALLLGLYGHNPGDQGRE